MGNFWDEEVELIWSCFESLEGMQQFSLDQEMDKYWCRGWTWHGLIPQACLWDFQQWYNCIQSQKNIWKCSKILMTSFFWSTHFLSRSLLRGGLLTQTQLCYFHHWKCKTLEESKEKGTGRTKKKAKVQRKSGSKPTLPAEKLNELIYRKREKVRPVHNWSQETHVERHVRTRWQRPSGACVRRSAARHSEPSGLFRVLSEWLMADFFTHKIPLTLNITPLFAISSLECLR